MMAFLLQKEAASRRDTAVSPSPYCFEKVLYLYAFSFTCLFLPDQKKKKKHFVEPKEGVHMCFSFLNVGSLFQTPT